MKLTPKQQRFVEEYLIDLNATQAAIRAGYSVATADQLGYQLLHKTSVARAIDEEKAHRAVRTGINADRVLREYARIAFADLRKVTEWSPGRGVVLKDSTELSDDEAAALSEVSETEFKGKRTLAVKLHSKSDALKALAKHVGLFEGSEPAEENGLAAFSKALDATTPDVWEDFELDQDDAGGDTDG